MSEEATEELIEEAEKIVCDEAREILGFIHERHTHPLVAMGALGVAAAAMIKVLCREGYDEAYPEFLELVECYACEDTPDEE